MKYYVIVCVIVSVVYCRQNPPAIDYDDYDYFETGEGFSVITTVPNNTDKNLSDVLQKTCEYQVCEFVRNTYH